MLCLLQNLMEQTLVRETEGIPKLKCDSKNYLTTLLWSKVVADGKKKATTQKDPILPILLIRDRSNLFLIGNGINRHKG